MATHDYVIANQGFPAFRSDLNNALAAIVSNNSSATEPTTMFAHMIWVDTAANPSILKIRNADNDAWITIGSIDQTGDTFTLVNLKTSGPVVFNDAGADVDFRVEGDTDANLLFVDAGNDRVGIGTSSPTARLTLDGGTSGDQLRIGNDPYYYKIGRDVVSGPLEFYGTQSGVIAYVFGGANGERMRIDTSGNLLVGTTGLPVSNGKLSVSGLSRLFATGDSSAALAVDKNTATTTTSQVFAYFTISNQTNGSGQINANGANQAAFGTFSDRRLKQNIVNLDSQWENIKALRPVEFDYIKSEGGGHQIGFIAQEVEPVYPDLVGERADGMLTLSSMGKNESRLIKALQEAIERIETLEAEVAALKGN